MFLSWRKRPRPELTRIHVDDIDRGEMLARASNPFERLYYGHEGHTAYKWHHYLALYDRHLSRFRGGPVRILELGISTADRSRSGRDILANAPSFMAWTAIRLVVDLPRIAS